MIRKRSLLPLISVLAAALVACERSEGRPQDVGIAGDGNLRAVLEAVRLEAELPALVAITVHDGRVVELAAAGVRATGNDEYVTSDDLWHIGSLTKAVTATLAAILVEQGRLAWDTTVGQVFPGLVGSMRAQYVDVPLQELLYHTAGLPVDVTGAPSWGSLFTDDTSITVQRRRFVAELLAMTPAGPRGQFEYSNAGYVVAGTMMEQVTGESWEELIVDLLFTPLGMSSCGFGAPGGPDRDQPWGHRGKAGNWNAVQPGPFADNPAALGPAGTVHCSAADYGKYMTEHLAGATGVDGIVSAASYEKLHTPAAGSSYAMGWGVAVRGWADGQVLTHHGSNTMWWASVWLAPKRGLGFFAVANAGGDDAFAGTDAAVAALLQRLEAASDP